MGIVFQQAANSVELTSGATHDTDVLPRPSGSNAIVVCVLNTSSEGIFIAFGASTVEAGPTHVTVAAGERAFFMVPAGATHVSIESVGTDASPVYVTAGYAGHGNAS
jgi:hypothetical protein